MRYYKENPLAGED